VGQQTVPAAKVASKPRDAWETEDVCEHVVKGHTEMMRNKQFYIDVLAPGHVGAEFRGAFVSQARRTRFQQLVAAVVAHYQRAGADLAGAFVWLDIFGACRLLSRTRCRRSDRAHPVKGSHTLSTFYLTHNQTPFDSSTRRGCVLLHRFRRELAAPSTARAIGRVWRLGY
jgi:hypothetical protein